MSELAPESWIYNINMQLISQQYTTLFTLITYANILKQTVHL